MLEANLHDYLKLKGKVSLPGLGQFEYIRHNAFINSTGNLSPPSATVYFMHKVFSISAFDQFKQFAARNNDLPLKNIENSIQDELENWNAALTAGQELSLPGLGVLALEEGKRIIFKHKAFSGPFSPALRPLEAHKIVREEFPTPNIKTEAKTVTGKSLFAAKIWSELGLGFMIFLLFAIGYYISKLTSCTTNAEIRNPLVELTHIDESRLNKNPAEFTVIPDVDDSNIISTGDEEFLVPNNSIPDMEHKYMSPSTDKKSELDNFPQSGVDQNCIIILGSFLKHKNADHFGHFLEEKGLKVYSGTYGKYKRIGVYEPCDDLMARLADYRVTLESGAWILQ